MQAFFLRFGWTGALLVILFLITGGIALIVNRAIVGVYPTEKPLIEQIVLDKTKKVEEKNSGEVQSNITEGKPAEVINKKPANDLEIATDKSNTKTSLSLDKKGVENFDTKGIGKTIQTATGNNFVPKGSIGNQILSKEKNSAKKNVPESEGYVVVPELELIRVEESGDTVVAGKASPKTKVRATVGGKVLGTSTANDLGDFVIVGKVQGSDSAQQIIVESKDREQADEISTDDMKIGQRTVSEEIWLPSLETFFVLPKIVGNEKIGLDHLASSRLVVVETTEDDIRIFNSNIIELVESITLDLIRYSRNGIAILDGRARAGMMVLFYIDNVFQIEANPSLTGSWSVSLEDVEPGVHTLRIDEVDDDGEVVSRIETPFKREPKDLLDKMFVDSVTVQPGNSLWRIARHIYGRGVLYADIYRKNSHLIRDPNLIYPGQVLSLAD